MARPVKKIAYGSMALENRLVEDVLELVRQSVDDIGLLARPVRIVTHSGSLRDHLGSLLVREFGASLAGVTVQTLFSLALEILDRSGENPPKGNNLFDVIVRREARRETILSRDLDDLADGYGSVVRSVRDFFDAGFDPVHLEAVEERLDAVAEDSGDSKIIDRARTLARVAQRTAWTMEERGVGLREAVLQSARNCLDRTGDDALPTRTVLIHGFADATGVVADFIESVIRTWDSAVYLNHPPDPANPAVTDIGVAFSERFESRLDLLCRDSEPQEQTQPPHIELFSAPGVNAEIRETAKRIGSLIEQGVPPERIGVAARDLTAYRVPIRLHFSRLGIPFSGAKATGPAKPVFRKAEALLDTLTLKTDAPLDRWLDASAGFASQDASETQRRMVLHDLRLALRTMGAVRIRDLAGLDIGSILNGRDSYPLPVRKGFIEDSGMEETLRPRVDRRKLAAEILTNAQHSAKELEKRWKKWPDVVDVAEHAAYLEETLKDVLGRSQDEEATKDIYQAIRSMVRSNPPDFPLDYDEFVLLLRYALADVGKTPLGGAGGGVRIVDAMEARGLVFDYLFVVGMNGGVFPRVVSEDPLLSDDLRLAISDVLPDMPVKKIGFEEERYLFAQLISSSPRVTLSHRFIDEDGKQKTVSPFVERIRLEHADRPLVTVKSLYAPDIPPGGAPQEDGPEPPVTSIRPAYEHAVLAGLYGSRKRFGRTLALALEEAENAAGREKKRNPGGPNRPGARRGARRNGPRQADTRRKEPSPAVQPLLGVHRSRAVSERSAERILVYHDPGKHGRVPVEDVRPSPPSHRTRSGPHGSAARSRRPDARKRCPQRAGKDRQTFDCGSPRGPGKRPSDRSDSRFLASRKGTGIDDPRGGSANDTGRGDRPFRDGKSIGIEDTAGDRTGEAVRLG